MKSPTVRLTLIVVSALAAALPLQAQTPGPSAEQLKSWIATRQQRMDLLREEFKQTDARIESRLDVVIDTLTSIGDSKDSRTKVARMKEDTMKRLLKVIEAYDQKRTVIRQELRNPESRLTDDEKRKIIAAFDVRIEKRTKQILALNKSMPAHQDYERYKATGGGWHGTDYERNQDFEQNRRMTSHTNAQRDALVKQLDSSLARLDRLGRALRSQLAATTNEPSLQKERAAEIAKNDALIAERRQQKLELLQPSDRAPRGVALKEATDLDQALKKAIDELRRDFTTLFARYNSLVSELTALHATEAALAAKTAG
jgi:hypothetical protein